MVLLPLPPPPPLTLHLDSTDKQKKPEIYENRINIETKILHDGELNRARHMPQKFNIIASKTTGGDIHIFDFT